MPPEAVVEALYVADRENRALDKAFNAAAGDVETMTDIIAAQVSFVEVYVLHLLDVLGLAAIATPGSWWADKITQAEQHFQPPIEQRDC